jgi:hypothetical protein
MIAIFRGALQRLQTGEIVEKPGSRMERVAELDAAAIESIMLANPFEKFERRKFIHRLKELTLLKFDPTLWKHLIDTCHALKKRGWAELIDLKVDAKGKIDLE